MPVNRKSLACEENIILLLWENTSSDIITGQTTSRLTNKEDNPWCCLALSPGHVDVPVARSARHLAEGNPDAHCNHQSEGDHPSDHVRRAVS